MSGGLGVCSCTMSGSEEAKTDTVLQNNVSVIEVTVSGELKKARRMVRTNCEYEW